LNDWVAIIVGLAAATKAGPRAVARFGKTCGDRACGFIEYREIRVDPLYILSSAHGTDGIGGSILI
jgi:hypothetical protein